MPEITFTSATGDVRVIDAPEGESVMHAAVRNGVDGVVGECGGVLSCATCHVFVDEDDLLKLSPMGPIEDEMLDGAAVDREACSRLSCQITLSAELGPLRVTTPEFQE